MERRREERREESGETRQERRERREERGEERGERREERREGRGEKERREDDPGPKFLDWCHTWGAILFAMDVSRVCIRARGSYQVLYCRILVFMLSLGSLFIVKLPTQKHYYDSYIEAADARYLGILDP